MKTKLYFGVGVLAVSCANLVVSCVDRKWTYAVIETVICVVWARLVWVEAGNKT